jgi:anti-sigma B factor antagonist
VEAAGFEIVLAHLDGIVRVKLRGDFDYPAQAQHAKALAEIVDLRSRVVLDLADLDFIDSVGLSFLVKLARAHYGPLRLVNVPDRILRLLEVTGLEEVFEYPAPTR